MGHPLYSTNAWKLARKRHLAEHPLCEMCRKSGRVVAGTVVDHKTPHKGDASLFWDTANWQTLCTWHHNAHKQSLEKGGRGRYEIGANGYPVDPAHPFNQ